MSEAPEAKEERWARRPSSGGGRKIVAWLVIIGLAALAGALAAERNARSFALEQVDGALVVKKGLFFPIGTRAWAPPDPKLAPAYAPLAPPPGFALAQEQTFAGREELDQALYDLLSRWAREDVASQARDRLARALGYVGRAELLPGLSAAQREDLERLRAEAGFFEGKDLVGRAADELRQARERLLRTARSASAHAGEASEAVRALDDALDGLHRAARAFGGNGAEPPTATGTAAPNSTATATETPTPNSTPAETATGTGSKTETETKTETGTAAKTGTAAPTPAAK